MFQDQACAGRPMRRAWRAILVMACVLSFARIAAADSLSLTDEERAWITEHPVVRIAVAPDWSRSSTSKKATTLVCLLTMYTCWSVRRGFDSRRSEEHTSELQSLMRRSSAVFCLKKKNIHTK